MTLTALVDTKPRGGRGELGHRAAEGVGRGTISRRPTPADLPKNFGSLLSAG